MTIEDLNINKKIATLVLTSFLLAGASGCNKQVVDLKKSFNVAVENNEGIISVVGIHNYRDYVGSQVEYVTNDNLRILSSTLQTQLVKSESADNLDRYVSSLTHNQSDIIYYDELQGGAISFDEDAWNKDIVGGHYTYNKALILSDHYVTIIPIKKWKDYEEDDKIQLILEDGTVMYTSADKLKLINDENAAENSLENYAISLVGSLDNVIYYGANQNVK